MGLLQIFSRGSPISHVDVCLHQEHHRHGRVLVFHLQCREQDGDGFTASAGVEQVFCQFQPGDTKIGLLRDGDAILLDCVGRAVLVFAHVGEPCVRFGIVGLDLDGFFELGHCQVVFGLGGQRSAVVHVYLRQIRTRGAGSQVEIFHFFGSRLVRVLRDVKKVHQAIRILGILFQNLFVNL